MALRFLFIALLLKQALCHEKAESCEHCDLGLTEDAAFLQGRAHMPHIERAAAPPKNRNSWAKTAMKKFNHHRHLHEKVVDSTDYRKDCEEFYETVKDLSLAERCPAVKIMSLEEVQKRWKVEYKYMEGVSKKDWDIELEDLKADFASMLNNGKPVIVQGDVPRQLGWSAADHWGLDELAKFMGDTSWQRTTFNYPDWIIGLGNDTSLRAYISNHESKNNIFLFASENGCNESKHLKSLVDTVRSQFSPSPEWAYPSETCQGIIAVDGIGSSHGFHCHDPVWNTQVQGTKHWWLLEPHYGSTVEDEMGFMEWGGAPKPANSKESYEYPNACAMLKEVEPPVGVIKCITKPGEMLILPDSWMHATCGLTEYTIAAGGWLGGEGREPPPKSE